MHTRCCAGGQRIYLVTGIAVRRPIKPNISEAHRCLKLRFIMLHGFGPSQHCFLVSWAYGSWSLIQQKGLVAVSALELAVVSTAEGIARDSADWVHFPRNIYCSEQVLIYGFLGFMFMTRTLVILKIKTFKKNLETYTGLRKCVWFAGLRLFDSWTEMTMTIDDVGPNRGFNDLIYQTRKWISAESVRDILVSGILVEPRLIIYHSEAPRSSWIYSCSERWTQDHSVWYSILCMISYNTCISYITYIYTVCTIHDTRLAFQSCTELRTTDSF